MRCSGKKTNEEPSRAPVRMLEEWSGGITQVTESSGNGIFSKILAGSVSPALLLIVVLGFVATQFSQAQTFSVLYNFGGAADGGDPYAGVIRDSNGNLYGTVGYGGTASARGGYKGASLGTETILSNLPTAPRRH